MWEAVAPASASVRPPFHTTTGLMPEAALILSNRARLSLGPSRYRPMISVLGSMARYSRKSALPRSQPLPMLITLLKAIRRVEPTSSIFPACPPLWVMYPTEPGLPSSVEGPQGMPCSGQETPMQLGPIILNPPRLARLTISSSTAIHSGSQVSRNPAVKNSTAFTFFSAQSSSRSSAESRGMQTTTRSTGPGIEVRLSWIFIPNTSPPLGFTP